MFGRPLVSGRLNLITSRRQVQLGCQLPDPETLVTSRQSIPSFFNRNSNIDQRPAERREGPRKRQRRPGSRIPKATMDGFYNLAWLSFGLRCACCLCARLPFSSSLFSAAACPSVPLLCLAAAREKEKKRRDEGRLDKGPRGSD